MKRNFKGIFNHKVRLSAVIYHILFFINLAETRKGGIIKMFHVSSCNVLVI